MSIEPARKRTRGHHGVLDLFDMFTMGLPRDDLDWHPNMDIVEKPDAWHVHADLPGVAQDKLEVQVDQGVLVISGSRSHEHIEEKSRGYKRIERSFGAFRRSFTLPDNADDASMTATLNDGVLEVTIPKKAVTQGKRHIPISVGPKEAPSSE